MQVKNNILNATVICFLFISFHAPVFAQERSKKAPKGAFYISWGYNTESYTRSTVHVKQDAIGDNFDMIHVNAQDHRGWDDGVLHKQLSIPQYNWRIGYYFNDNKDLGVELNFDHTKYIITEGQTIHFSGTHNHLPIDSNIVFGHSTGFYYYLNNGANFLLFNLVKRMPLYHTHSNKLNVDFVGKAGIGPVVPHVENSFFNIPNQPHFQLGGWNTGLEAVLRVTIMHYGFIEFSQKLDYARYSGLKIFDGTARQNFGTYESILSIGAILPTHRHNPMFQAEAKKAE